MKASTEVNGNQYQIGRLDAMVAFHVARRIAPIMTELGISVVELANQADLAGKSFDDILPQLMKPAMLVIAKMDDSNVEYVAHACLAVVSRDQSGKWAPVQSPNGKLMFQDIDMTAMIRLVLEVIRENLSDFFPMLQGVTGSPPSSGEAGQT